MNLDEDPQKKEWLSLPDCPVSFPKLASFVDSGDGLQWGGGALQLRQEGLWTVSVAHRALMCSLYWDYRSHYFLQSG